ncbi:hypothetical protein N7537_011075 [Penicillium hordei]|uniref:Uncharacterized protein n=1 Tax=Penicillium hordei TaxID=40994 RepID=A0AAD6DL64_9EURO|nr:uncharacterized protein N7537_011075 [Penicillium hordei]KAJ5588397.1 hypothetical protein N7537_011075 [Penicillium hordei]
MVDYNFAKRTRTKPSSQPTTAAEHTSTDSQVNELQDGVAKVAGTLSISSASGNWQHKYSTPRWGASLIPRLQHLARESG